MTRIELSKVMMIVEAEYGSRFEATPERLEVWFEILGRYEFQDARRGALAAIAVATQWPPSVGEVRNHTAAMRKERLRIEKVNHDLGGKGVVQTDPTVAAKCKALLNDFLISTGARKP